VYKMFSIGIRIPNNEKSPKDISISVGTSNLKLKRWTTY
jgi:hypothetical protein